MPDIGWLLIFVVLFLAIVFIAGKAKWDAYVKMAQLRPDERVVHHEKNVTIRNKSWASFPYDWTYADGAASEDGWLVAEVFVTNERILVFRKGVPCSIVDYTRHEALPRSWLAWRQSFLMNVSSDDIRVLDDESGNSCLEVIYSPNKRDGVRKRYYLRDLDVLRVHFPTPEQKVTLA